MQLAVHLWRGRRQSLSTHRTVMASKADAAPKPAGASRPAGTDGSDYSYRMTVDYRAWLAASATRLRLSP